MINKINIRKIIVVLLIGCITVQSMMPNSIWAKTRKEVPVTSFISLENNEYIGMTENALALSKMEGEKQQWRIEPVDKVFCTIKNEQNNKLMQIEQAVDGEWSVSLVSKVTLEDEQLWYVEMCEVDTYRIKSKVNDMCLEIEKEDDGKYSFSLGEVAEENTQLWKVNEKSYDYANQYFTYLENQNPEVVSKKEQIKIDKLQEERFQLCQNYEENQTEIVEIDNELESLGVVELTAAEVAEKMGIENEGMSPNARIATYPTVDGVEWSSSRVYEVCRGKVIELQILVGEPQDNTNYNSSELISRQVIEIHAANFELGTRNLLKVMAEDIVVGAVEETPVVGGIIEAGVTAYSWVEAFMSGVATDTVIDNAEVVYIVEQYGQTKMVFAKYLDYSDELQVLAYVGNKSNMAIIVNKPSIYVGNTYPEMETEEYTGFVSSPRYDSGFKAYAAQLYYNFKNDLPEMEEWLLVYGFNLNVINEADYTVSMPVYY